ncbi:MAG: M23 family metallopeptidase [Steroidobacteraceae bacterium]
MSLFIFSQGRSGRSRQLALVHPLARGGLAAAGLAILGAIFVLGVQLGRYDGRTVGRNEINHWSVVLAKQKAEVGALRQQLQERTDALAIRMARLDAHVIRIDELGKRLVQMAHINPQEFDFDEDPPVGGPPGHDNGEAPQVPDMSTALKQLRQQIDLRDVQLSALQNVILNRRLDAAIHPEGRPVLTGFISSYFGERTDPFTGREEFHEGIDFAGVAGSPVVAVAAGVVTWAGPRDGFGNVVEINHGNGYVTLYAHNERLLVKVGQTVSRGESIALMGSTGRSTGPHVHFEVLHDGRPVNPISFIRR